MVKLSSYNYFLFMSLAPFWIYRNRDGHDAIEPRMHALHDGIPFIEFEAFDMRPVA